MPRRHPSLPDAPALPRLWLMTDERIGNDLWRAIRALPRGAGIVFRHHATPPAERRALFRKITKCARRRGLLLVRAGSVGLAGEDGVHGRRSPTSGQIRPGQIRTWSAHSRREAMAGVRAGADLLFVSPVFATRSHPGARALGPVRAATIIRGLPIPAIALGGMSARRYPRLKRLGFHGWAAIDAWVAPQS